MVNSISATNATAQGISSLLQQSNTSSSGDLFNSLAGTNVDTSNNALFATLGGKGGTNQSIDSILQQKKVDSSKNDIYNNVALRLAGIQAGTHTPTTTWEKVAGYAMAKGNPVVVSIDSSGQIQAQLQSESSLSKFNPQIQKQITQLVNGASLMAQKIQANTTNDSWVKKLTGASNDLNQVYNNLVAPQTQTTNNWEQAGILMMQAAEPFKISLDANGDLQVQDQATDPANATLPESQQKLLAQAVQDIPAAIKAGGIWGASVPQATRNALNGALLQAQSFYYNGVPYYLDIDPSTNTVTAKENSGDNITPSFLKNTPYPDVGDNSPALKQAETFIKAGKAYFFDVDSTGQIGAKEATVQNISKYNTTTTSPTTTLGSGAILSLFA